MLGKLEEKRKQDEQQGGRTQVIVVSSSLEVLRKVMEKSYLYGHRKSKMI